MPRKRKAATIGVLEFQRRFHDPEQAIEYFESVRWPNGPVCPRCNQNDRIKPWRTMRWCGHCRQYFTAKTGTMMETSNLPILTWLLAMYFLVTARKGISSLQLSKELSISQNSTWFLLHRIREACGPSLEPLHGEVEVDETFIGGKEENKHAHKKLHEKSHEGKQPVLGMRHRGGRTIAKPVPDIARKTLWDEIQKNVKP